ncbi:hypothetical protein IMSAGC007_04232 [Lachnospiraceae bacterium]|nr:hypothetical protein IMSAGC007_04232 [Lachnospiraceae bacterium]GFI29394.1 hypothetical protein IMSAGC013_00780 [Lachnospiraceae bacterium]
MIDVSDICSGIKRGEDVTEAVAKLEPKLKRFCENRNNNVFMNEETLCDEDALYEVSPSVKTYWNTVYATYQNPKDKYQALLRFVNARERCLGVSHIKSVHILKECGWTAADIMAAYIHNRVKTSRLLLSPDVAEEAAKEDWDTALQLLEGKNYDIFFPFYHKSYQMCRQFEWIDFIYCYMGYNDKTFLMKSHKSKRLCKYCGEILEKLARTSIGADNLPKINECPDFSVFQNIVLKQKRLMHSAAGQKLRNGNSQNGYYVMSFHFIDEQMGCGAALCFEALNKSPDYGDTSAKSKGVYFYRFNALYLSDYIPESRWQAAEDMPEEFVKKAYRAFSMAAGLDGGR